VLESKAKSTVTSVSGATSTGSWWMVVTASGETIEVR
jgi:hypothetical protein